MWFKLLLLGIVSAVAVNAATTQTPEANCEDATVCNDDECKLPDCLCSGKETQVPEYNKRPQIIYLTYDDAFTQYAKENFYDHLFNGDGVTNPDGCRVRATHFLTAQYTDYTLVHEYWEMGHEMASHSITHRTNQDYWKGLNVDGWEAEAEGMRKMISQFAAIPKEDVSGFRAPFLQMGGDEMYTALYQNDFKYDCSWVSLDFGYLHLDHGLYPYTLDYSSIQDCPIQPCPTCSYPGFWVQPMLDLEDLWVGANPLYPDNGMPCSMLDGCIIIQDDADRTTVKEMLMQNFNRVYKNEGSRAPLGLYMHAGWFFGELAWHFDGYMDFLKEVTSTYDDVWIVPITDGLDYFQNYNNYTNEQLLALGDNNPLSCKKYNHRPSGVPCDPINPCRFEDVNNEDIHGQERYMHMCGRKPTGQRQNCPARYPWLSDPCGGNTPCA